MAVSGEFEKLNMIYTAIRDIDKIIASNSDGKIDEIINAVKNIDKSTFDQDSQNKITSGFREALVKIYQDTFASLNDIIENPPKDDTKYQMPSRPIDNAMNAAKVVTSYNRNNLMPRKEGANGEIKEMEN